MGRSKPMTTSQAKVKHNDEDDVYGIESETCSVLCVWCGGRVWFTGEYREQDNHFKCPYCEQGQINPLLGKKKEVDDG